MLLTGNGLLCTIFTAFIDIGSIFLMKKGSILNAEIKASEISRTETKPLNIFNSKHIQDFSIYNSIERLFS